MWFLLQRTPRRSTFEVGFLRKRSERQGTRSPIKAFGISIYIFVSKEDRSSRRFYLTMKRFHRSANSIYTSLHTGIVTKSTRKFANWKHASRWQQLLLRFLFCLSQTSTHTLLLLLLPFIKWNTNRTRCEASAPYPRTANTTWGSEWNRPESATESPTPSIPCLHTHTPLSLLRTIPHSLPSLSTMKYSSVHSANRPRNTPQHHFTVVGNGAMSGP